MTQREESIGTWNRVINRALLSLAHTKTREQAKHETEDLKRILANLDQWLTDDLDLTIFNDKGEQDETNNR